MHPYTAAGFMSSARHLFHKESIKGSIYGLRSAAEALIYPVRKKELEKSDSIYFSLADRGPSVQLLSLFLLVRTFNNGQP
jgi:hypothetical protein